MDEETENKPEILEQQEPEKKTDKKQIWKIVIIFALAILFLVICIILQGPVNIQNLILREGMNLTESDCVNFPGNYLFYSAGCPHCISAISEIKEVEENRNISYDVHYLDINNQSTLDFLAETHIVVSQVPTLISNCTVYIGEKSVEEYGIILE